ncbi:MAG: hypothetical protein DRP85_08875 [Candidatus Makaraimicrobium thalassicum]|nr:MAG: hypothetical protein DRP85_08875 [Candidatus Omnitrophota bacterium]
MSKSYKLEITVDEEGALSCSQQSEGFSTLELIALLELAKAEALESVMNSNKNEDEKEIEKEPSVILLNEDM